ncbi:ComEC/Rec2 family competence protein [Methylobrevis pamukkalensis]|uniref:ComEC family competence protein n=1 Tax=Methylobrevis pamukkalensis TaxID=1439726 RepID=A0A1E3H4A7_9HYPH|nr:ComEC/Rec2 family competence protein [Methylobrevis pamukkalensis]ODN71159.1 ComEC family competence protein [Methylobrevis pamukkalensis]
MTDRGLAGRPLSVRGAGPVGVLQWLGRAVPRGLAGLRRGLAEDITAGRGFLWLPVALGGGIALYFLLPFEPPPATFVAAGLVTVAASLVARWRHAFAALLLAMACGGVCLAAAHTRIGAHPMILTERTATVTAFVERAEARRGGLTRLVLRPIAISRTRPEDLPARLTVSVRASETSLAPGAAVELLARLAPPSAPVVPGGYDFARKAYFDGIGGTGFALGPVRALAVTPPLPADMTPVVALEAFRQRVGEGIRAQLPGDAGAIAAALMVGDRGAISLAADEAMRISGLSHVLSISGLHMSLVTAVLYGLVRALLAAIPPLALRLPVKSIAAVVGLAGALGYLAVSGMSVATQRSAIMTALVLVAVILGRSAINLRLVAVAALLVLLIAPEAALDPGAQMSFAAVAALISAYEWFAARLRSQQQKSPQGGFVSEGPRRLWRFVGGLMLTSLIAGLATAPIAAWHFDRVSPLGLVANLLAVPLVTFVIMPAAVLAGLAMPTGLEGPALVAMGWGIDGMLAIARMVSDWTPSGGIVPHPPLEAVLLMIAGGTWLALWNGGHRRLGLLPLALGVLLMPFGPRPDLLISGSGTGVLIIAGDGVPRLVGRASSFEASTWLRHVGSPLAPDDRRLRQGVACDRDACILRMGEAARPQTAAQGTEPGTADATASRTLYIAVIRHPAAFREECRRADLVVTGLDAPRWCQDHAAVIDRSTLRETGASTWRTAAVAGEQVRLDLVATALSGEGRPWTPAGAVERSARRSERPSRPASRPQPASESPPVAAPQ